MSKIVVVYFSGYGHTKVVAETIAQEISATLVPINEQGEIAESAWQTLEAADTIVFGAPTYMGAAPWQFKKFADASSKQWYSRSWQNKLFAGFSNSASLNGDKQNTLIQFQTLAAQHGGLWISLGILPSNQKQSNHDDVNYLGGSIGLLVQSPADASVTEIPAGDLATAKQFAQRIAEITARWVQA